MNIAVYGASGHTGRFVSAELLRRGHTAIAIARDGAKIAGAVALLHGDVETRTAALDVPASLDDALRGADAVIHCAGPFLDTARPVIEAALRAGIHYFDVTAEQGSALSTFELFDKPARDRGVCVVPAAGFYGGLGDLLGTSAMHEWQRADRIAYRPAKYGASPRALRWKADANAAVCTGNVDISGAIRSARCDRDTVHRNDFAASSSASS